MGVRVLNALGWKTNRPGNIPGLLTCGANDRTRTGDLRITSALLYQLSHVGNSTFSSAIWQYIAVACLAQLRFAAHEMLKKPRANRGAVPMPPQAWGRQARRTRRRNAGSGWRLP